MNALSHNNPPTTLPSHHIQPRHTHSAMRTLPNIVITGTPGVGKTTTCTQLVSLTASTPTPLKHLCVNTLVKDRGCHSGYDEELKTLIVDEDKLLDEMEKELEEEPDGGFLVDWHACDLFPRRWVDLVVVLRCEETSVMYDRLKARGYERRKLDENVDAEIFGVVAEEAREAFDEGEMVEFKSETVEDVEANCERVLAWVERWREGNEKERRKGGDT